LEGILLSICFPWLFERHFKIQVNVPGPIFTGIKGPHMAEPSKGPNLVKLIPEDFTWHKDCHLFSKKIPYDTWQVPNWYPLGITRGKK
jgi:hypothetical protein